MSAFDINIQCWDLIYDTTISKEVAKLMGLEDGVWEKIKMYNFRYPFEGNHGGFVYYTEDGQAIAAVKFETEERETFITVSEPAPHRLYIKPDLNLFQGFKGTTLETGWEFTYDVNYGEHGAFIYHKDNSADLDILAVGSALSSGDMLAPTAPDIPEP